MLKDKLREEANHINMFLIEILRLPPRDDIATQCLSRNDNKSKDVLPDSGG